MFMRIQLMWEIYEYRQGKNNDKNKKNLTSFHCNYNFLICLKHYWTHDSKFFWRSVCFYSLFSEKLSVTALVACF